MALCRPLTQAEELRYDNFARASEATMADFMTALEKSDEFRHAVHGQPLAQAVKLFLAAREAEAKAARAHAKAQAAMTDAEKAGHEESIERLERVLGTTELKTADLNLESE